MTLNKLSIVAVAMTLALVNFSQAETAQAEDRFAAICYSSDIGQIGYSFNATNSVDAQLLAIKKADALGTDPVMWVQNGFVVLALGDDPTAYAMSWGATAEEAKLNALQEVSKYTTNCFIALTIHSQFGEQ